MPQRMMVRCFVYMLYFTHSPMHTFDTLYNIIHGLYDKNKRARDQTIQIHKHKYILDKICKCEFCIIVHVFQFYIIFYIRVYLYYCDTQNNSVCVCAIVTMSVLIHSQRDIYLQFRLPMVGLSHKHTLSHTHRKNLESTFQFFDTRKKYTECAAEWGRKSGKDHGKSVCVCVCVTNKAMAIFLWNIKLVCCYAE